MNKTWKSISKNGYPPVNKRKYYIVYHPDYTGYAFKCSFVEAGFAGINVGTMIDATHYRDCGKTEKDHQLTDDELEKVKL